MNIHVRQQRYSQQPNPNYKPMTPGVVVAILSKEQSKTISSIVSSGSLTNPRLFIIPRILFTKEYLQATYKDISKSRMLKLQREFDIGEEIDFFTDHNGGKVVSNFEHRFKNQKIYEYEMRPLEGNVIEFYFDATISNERERRFHCGSLPNLAVPQRLLRGNLPNVLYLIAARTTVDLGQLEVDSEPADCQPRLTVEFSRFLFPSPKIWEDFASAQTIVADTLWNHGRHFPEVNPLYPRMVLSHSDSNMHIESACVILNEMEVYCRERPNNKCLVAFVSPNDFLFIEGRSVWAELYYCRYNEAYILYRYKCHFYPDPEKYPAEDGKDSLHASDENPMKTRIINETKEFMAYVKLNRINHFFSSYAIHLIEDPKKITHGRVQLGDQEDPDWHRESKQECGMRVWIRYLPNKRGIKWEISDIYENKGEQSKLEHKAFVSLGLKLSRLDGFVYCPSVCNFPLHLEDEICAEVDVGDWFRFEAKFNETEQRYKIFKIDRVIERKKFKMIKLASHLDVYAFKIPLHQNYLYTRNLLKNDDIGFVEDVETRVTLYICKWEETHRKPKELHVNVDVWCRYNPDEDGRKTPLCVIDITNPPGIPYP